MMSGGRTIYSRRFIGGCQMLSNGMQIRGYGDIAIDVLECTKRPSYCTVFKHLKNKQNQGLYTGLL